MQNEFNRHRAKLQDDLSQERVLQQIATHRAASEAARAKRGEAERDRVQKELDAALERIRWWETNFKVEPRVLDLEAKLRAAEESLQQQAAKQRLLLRQLDESWRKAAATDEQLRQARAKCSEES